MTEPRRRRSSAIQVQTPIPFDQVDAILASDLHVRHDSPICRTDDFQVAMWKKIKFIVDLCKKCGCPLLIGGDVGHRSQWPNWLLVKFMDIIKEIEVVSCLGQHDLPGHNLEEFEASGCGVLKQANSIRFRNCFVGHKEGKVYLHDVEVFHWGQDMVTATNTPCIALTHQMVMNGNPDYPGQEGSQGIDLLKKNSYQLILSGDNHKPFIVEYDGKILVNPGSMMRTTAAQADHRPRVYAWNASLNAVHPIYLPIQEDVVDRTHIDEKQDRDARMDALVDRVKIDYDAGFSFEQNMEAHLLSNKTPADVKEKVWGAMEQK